MDSQDESLKFMTSTSEWLRCCLCTSLWVAISLKLLTLISFGLLQHQDDHLLKSHQQQWTVLLLSQEWERHSSTSTDRMSRRTKYTEGQVCRRINPMKQMTRRHFKTTLTVEWMNSRRHDMHTWTSVLSFQSLSVFLTTSVFNKHSWSSAALVKTSSDSRSNTQQIPFPKRSFSRCFKGRQAAHPLTLMTHEMRTMMAVSVENHYEMKAHGLL